MKADITDTIVTTNRKKILRTRRPVEKLSNLLIHQQRLFAIRQDDGGFLPDLENSPVGAVCFNKQVYLTDVHVIA